MTTTTKSPLRTPFYDSHVAASAKLVDFAGWSLPIHYGSLVDEHTAVRSDVGMFDVSHMVVMDIHGEPSINSLRLTIANDIAKLSDNTALYSCLCRDNGGVVDDLIVYRINETHYRVISNAATRSKVLDWFASHGVSEIDSIDAEELAMLAVQGPNAVTKVQSVAKTLFGTDLNIDALPNFGCTSVTGGFVGRTGYTGEDGVEIIVPKANASDSWAALVAAGVKPCGLGARDTLRLEAGMSLYGNDTAQKSNGSSSMRIGIELSDRGVLRAGQKVILDSKEIGVITSGTFSPTLQRTIALARVERASVPDVDNKDAGLSVEIRNKSVSAYRVAVPFLRSS